MATWQELENECASCTRCALCKTRLNVVLGAGDRSARILFVGEAPGASEDETGIPFVGRAGKLLDLFLFVVGLRTAEIYTTNIAKCRPPQNRDPLPEEEDACIPYLHTQIELIKPEMIVCLGRIAAMRLIKPDFKITQEHGRWFTYNGVPITATLHPAALLRDPRKKEDAYNDYKIIRAALDALPGKED